MHIAFVVSRRQSFFRYTMGNAFSTTAPPELDQMQTLFLEFVTEAYANNPLLSKAVHFDPSAGSSKWALMVGDVQAGKATASALYALFLAIVRREDVHVILRNCKVDMTQMDSSTFSRLKMEFLDFAVQRGVPFSVANKWDTHRWPSISILHNGDKKKTSDMRGQQRSGRILLSICHHTHLQSACDLFLTGDSGNDRRKRFHLVVDEADMVLSAHPDRLMAKALDTLTDHADSVLAVTATSHDLMMDERFTCCSTFVLPRPPDYKSVEDMEWVNIRSRPKSARRPKHGDVLLDADLLITLRAEADKGPYADNSQPAIGLIKTQSTDEGQNQLAKEIHDRLPQKFLTIVFNGKGVTLSCPAKQRQLAHILRQDQWKFKMGDDDTIHMNTDGIQRILSTLRENEWSTSIAIISDKVAGRGLNFACSKYKWHLSFLFLRVCKDTSVSNMMQDMRICGRYKDDIPLTLYCGEEEHKTLKVEFKAHNELVERARAYADGEASILDAIKKMRMDRRKTTKRKQLRYAGSRLPVQVVNPGPNGQVADGGWSIADYGITTPPPPVAVPVAQEVVVHGDNDGPPMDSAEFRRLTTKRFPDWARVDNTSAIARFMKEGLEAEKHYTKADLSELCTQYSIQKIEDIDRPRRNRVATGSTQAHSIGQIMEMMSSGHYRLHHQLRQAFANNFSGTH